MIRLAVLNLVMLGLMVVAARRWYWALCGLVFFATVAQHPNMPTNVLGIQGLNPWNATLVVVAAFWLMSRRNEPAAAPAPLWMPLLLAAYAGMIAVCALVAGLDKGTLPGLMGNRSVFQWAVVDGMVNPLKYLLLGVMFYDGARSRQRILLALFSAVGSCLVYALLMFKAINTRLFSLDVNDARRLTDKLVGLYANDMGELLAFAMWAGVCLLALLPRGRWRWVGVGGVLLMMPAFYVLKSRAGFVAFVAIGFVFGVVRWRRLLLVLPAGALAAVFFVPGLADRILTGFEDDGHLNWDEISAGRLTNIWPPVIDQIHQSPWVGHGRFAILRTDCAFEVLARERVLPTHPHNSYLEILLDAGVAGLALCLTWAAALTVVSIRLLWRREDPLTSTLGLVSLAAVTAELAAGVAGSSFFPSQSFVPYLCLWGALLRVWAEVRAAAARSVEPVRLPLRRRRLYTYTVSE